MKLLLVALAALAGIGFGVGVNAKGQVAGVVYYGYLDDTKKVRWTKFRPSIPRTCKLDFGFACTITSTQPELQVLTLVNQFPIQYTVLSNSWNKIYK